MVPTQAARYPNRKDLTLSVLGATIEAVKTDRGSRVEIRSAEWQVIDRLEQLNLTKVGLLDVVHQCVAGYSGCTDNDPPGVRGYEVWRMGIRGFRETFGGKDGWERSDSGGFSTIVNHTLALRVAVINTDEATGIVKGSRAPQNRLPKGSTAERAVSANQIIEQMSLALSGGGMRAPEPANVDDYQTWHFCIYVRGDTVRAELSRFNGYSDGFLSDCRERILIVGDGEWTALDIGGAGDPGPVFDFEIRRKQ